MLLFFLFFFPLLIWLNVTWRLWWKERCRVEWVGGSGKTIQSGGEGEGEWWECLLFESKSVLLLTWCLILFSLFIAGDAFAFELYYICWFSQTQHHLTSTQLYDVTCEIYIRVKGGTQKHRPFTGKKGYVKHTFIDKHIEWYMLGGGRHLKTSLATHNNFPLS